MTTYRLHWASMEANNLHNYLECIFKESTWALKCLRKAGSKKRSIEETGPSVMAEGHAVWRATSRRENLVHRIGKWKENKHRPIIARFVCREDRDQVFARKKGIKESTRFKDAYITVDYAKAIQDERRKLIKAMFKAKEQGSEAKVVGRYLYIGELKYDVTNIPQDFK